MCNLCPEPRPLYDDPDPEPDDEPEPCACDTLRIADRGRRLAALCSRCRASYEHEKCE